MLVPFGVIAQVFIDPGDNPTLDQIPLSLLKRSQENPDVIPLSSLITIDNFDLSVTYYILYQC